MPAIAVTTGGATLVASNTLLQNLGPGELYVGAPGLAAAAGVKVEVGQSLKLGAVSKVGLISVGGSCDVRYMVGADALGFLTV